MYSFKQFCEDTNNEELLNLWDYSLNSKRPEEVGYSSMKKYWFKCPRGLHSASEVPIGNITKAYKQNKKYCICHKCNSIGQYIIDNYGQDYLDSIWSDNNKTSYYDVEKSSKNIIWLKCNNNQGHPDYALSANNFHKSHSCPYCSGKKVCLTNSFGYMYPEAINIWSDKNEKTPFDYYYNSNEKVWFKCENGVHADYERKVKDQYAAKYFCPECGLEKRIQNTPRGEASPFWKGDSVDENRRLRNSSEYNNWRKIIYSKDNYTCQCCGKRGGKLNAHHLNDFASHEDLRLDPMNGITLCANCHDTTVKGSFHNLYGTKARTIHELEDYINDKRKSLGIDISFSVDSYLNGNVLQCLDVV